MIPESLRKQTRAIHLSFRKEVHNEVLSTEEEAELKVLKKEADKKTKRSLKRVFADLRASERHQKKTKNLSVGTYGSKPKSKLKAA